MAAAHEELLAAWEAELLSIEDGDQFIERVMVLSDRRPWDTGMRAVAVRVARRRSAAFAAAVEGAWPEVQALRAQLAQLEAAKKISAAPQPAAAESAAVQPSDPVGRALPVIERRLPADDPPEERAPPATAKKLIDPAVLRKIIESEKATKAAAAARAKAEAEQRARAKDPKAWPEAPQVPDRVAGFEKLTYPRGLVGHVTQYIEDTNALPNRPMALAAALSACAKMLDRKVLGPTGSGTVLYNLLVAETGAGKQHTINCIRMLLRTVGHEALIVASGIASVQAVEEIVEDCPAALVLIDEVGSWVSRISSQGMTGNVAEIPGILQSLWGWPPQSEWVGTKKVGKDMASKKAHGPQLSMYGASTEPALFGALKRKEVSSGFVNRMILFNAGRGALERREPPSDWTKIPKWLGEALKAIADDPSLPVPIKSFRRIGWGDGAKDRWFAFDKHCRNLPSADERALWVRAPENSIRIATVVAVFRGSLEVDVEDLEWAIALATASMSHLCRGLDRHMQEELTRADLTERIRDQFREAPLGTGQYQGKRVLTLGENPQTQRAVLRRRLLHHRSLPRPPSHLPGDCRTRNLPKCWPTNEEMGMAGEIISGIIVAQGDTPLRERIGRAKPRFLLRVLSKNTPPPSSPVLLLYI
jgi:hypothetical protein